MEKQFAIISFVDELIDNLYQVSRQLFIPVIQQFILKSCGGHYFPTDPEQGNPVNAYVLRAIGYGTTAT